MERNLFARFAIISLLVTTSCNFKSTQESVKQENDINKTITISAPLQINTFKLHDFVGIAVQNNSDHEVLISLESDIDIKAKKENQWVSIPVIQKSSRKILLAPKDQKEMSLTIFDIIPDIQGQNQATIRITIKGIDQSTKQEVFGYLDLVLSP